MHTCLPGASATPSQSGPSPSKRKLEDVKFDPMEYLTAHGKDKLDEVLSDVAKRMQSQAFREVGDDEKSVKAFQNDLRLALGLAARLHKDCINFQWKIKKRVNVPTESLEIISSYRGHATAVLNFLQQFQSKDAELMLDVDKCKKLGASITSLGVNIPVRCQTIQYKAQARAATVPLQLPKSAVSLVESVHPGCRAKSGIVEIIRRLFYTMKRQGAAKGKLTEAPKSDPAWYQQEFTRNGPTMPARHDTQTFRQGSVGW